MTHTQENRQQLVNAGAIPVLIGLLSSSDADVQYYCTTALSNIAVDASNRKKLAQTDSKLVQYLIALMETKSLKVQCQAALALRNLASDEKYQLEIVRCKGLTPLLRLLKSSFLPLILSSVACIRNISIHPANESPIIDEGFVNPLIELLSYDDNEEIQCHAISTLRNLAASSERNKRAIVEAGAVERIKTLINHVPTSVQTEMTAAIAVLALSDELKQRLLGMNVLEVLIPLTASQNIEVQGNSAAAIGNLSSKGICKSRRLYFLLFTYNCNSQGLFTFHQSLEDTVGRIIKLFDSIPGRGPRHCFPAHWCVDHRAVSRRKWYNVACSCIKQFSNCYPFR